MARKRRKFRRRYRRNPPFKFGGMMGDVGKRLQSSAIGALGIAANKFVANQVAPLLKVPAAQKQLVELGSAIFLMPMLARVTKMKMIGDAATVAGAAAIFDAVKQYLPENIKPMLAGRDDLNTDYMLGPASEPIQEYFDSSTPMPQFNY